MTESTLADLRREVSERMSSLNQEVGEARALALRGQELQARKEKLASDRETAERVSGVLSKLAADRDAAARAKVESLVTAGLTAIFGEGGEQLSFHLVESTQRNTAHIDFMVRTTKPNGEVIETDVMAARGGGVAAVIGVLLRVVLLLLTRQSGQKIADFLILDESFAMLSSDRLEAASAFLRALVDSAGLQIIMVTHQETLVESADRIYRFALGPDGVSRVTKLK